MKTRLEALILSPRDRGVTCSSRCKTTGVLPAWYRYRCRSLNIWTLLLTTSCISSATDTAMANALEDAALQFAETVQTASINHNPDPTRDIAPETSVDKKVPVQFSASGDVLSEAEDVGEDEVPVSVLRPLPEEPRAPKHLQLPDLRFEQSYLKSISHTNDWKVIAYITIKDQVRLHESFSEHCLTLAGFDAHGSGCRVCLVNLLVRY